MAVTSGGQDREFGRKLWDAIEGEFESCFTQGRYDWVLEWVEQNFGPEDVFDASDLEEWAKDNGFTKE